jgi:hypothetical protein
MVDTPRGTVPGGTPGQAPPPGVTTQEPSARHVPGANRSVFEEEGFSGWAWFTGVLMGLVGLFQIIAGIVALAESEFYAVPSRELVVNASYATWGWVHLLIGIVALVTGGGLAFGNPVARVAGVALAGLSALVNLVFIPASPVIATLIIALDVFLIYAITVHGGEPRQAR